MKFNQTILSALAVFAVLANAEIRADNMASIAIAPTTGQVTLVPRWTIGGGLAGFHFMAQDLSLGGGPSQFYSIKGAAIPAGGDISAFTRYSAGTGAATNHADIGSKLTPNSYSALTSADPDLGYGAVNFYFIHHKGTSDYFSVIKPSSGVASQVADLKPMSGPGGPATVTGVAGYFGFTFAAANLGYGLNLFYYLRTDPVTGNTKFGTLDPALLGTSADKFDLGLSGHNALAFTGSDVGYGTDKMYFIRLDPITGYSILGTLNPVTGRASDIANLGSVYSTLTFVPGDVSFGAGLFYTTGSVNNQWQSVSFAALADRAISTGAFTVTPSASSGLPIALTVVPGSTGAASITGPVAGVFTVTPTAPGVITLQATQAGSLGSYEYNMLRQSFTATGVATLVITTQPASQSAVGGTTANFSVTASGTTAVSYQWRKGGANIVGNASATTAALALTNAQAADAATYDVVVTNASGSIISNAVTLTVTGASPIITNSPLTAAGTVGTSFTFGITASGTPTSYSASPLPAGLAINTATGAITGTPTTVGTTSVLLGATNGTGTGNATLTITVAAAGVAPVLTTAPGGAGPAGTVGTPFNYAIVATGAPTGYTASPLPAGLTLNPTTGVITGTPTAVGTTNVALGATNATGTGSGTLTIVVAAAGVAPVITTAPGGTGSAGTVGTPFSYTIVAAGTPTSYTASPLPAGLTLNSTTGVITGTPTTAGTTNVALGATNATGTGSGALTIVVAAAGVAPVITTAPGGTGSAGTVGTPYIYTIVATGTPTSYTAAPLPAGLTLNSVTGVITGAPTTAGTTIVALGATNASGTSSGALTIIVAAAGTAPVITTAPGGTGSAGTVGTPFNYAIIATGTPTAYSATPLPPGLTLNNTTGVISGTPTTPGTTIVALGATNATGTSSGALTIVVAAAGIAPVITAAPGGVGSAGTVGTPYVYTIVATGTPTSYTATPLPAGLTLNPATGVITGTPAAAGTTTVTLGATNATGVSSGTLTIVVAPAGVAPVIASAPGGAGPAGTVGVLYLYTIVATGTPTGYTATPLPAGLTLNPTTGVISGTPTAAGSTTVTLGATNATGTTTGTLTITVGAAAGTPVITPPPGGTTPGGSVGAPFNYPVTASGTPTSYTANPLPPGLSINPTTGVISGTPTTPGTTLVTITATNANGTSTTTITIVVAAAPSSRIVNFAARAISGPGSQTLIMGFVVAGDGKNLLVRGIGPTLTSFGIANALADPMLTLFNSDVAVASNDDWQTTIGGQDQTALIAATAARVGAFTLPIGSKDSALLFTVNNGAHTTGLLRPNSTTGVALTEIYDIDTVPGSRLVNVSARMNVTAGEGTLIAGLVIAGNAPKTVLIRGVGPTLSVFGVAGVLADPQIAVFSGATVIAGNDNWETGASTAAQLTAAATQVGAFALPGGSKDAALVVTLQPGAYTVQVSGVGATTGVALIEVYELP